MADSAEGASSAYVHKYSDEQVEQSRQILGREPEGADLAAHHDAPAGGIAGDHPDADPVAAQDDSEGEA